MSEDRQIGLMGMPHSGTATTINIKFEGDIAPCGSRVSLSPNNIFLQLNLHGHMFQSNLFLKKKKYIYMYV
jgi:hypothetical protein